MIKSLLKKSLVIALASFSCQTSFAQTPPNANCELALNLNGATNYVQTASTYSLGSTYSCTGWIKTTSSNNNITQITDNQYYEIEIKTLSDGTLRYQHKYYLNNSSAVSNTVVNDGNWHHYAAVKTTDSLILYIDGVKESAALNTSSYPTQFDFTTQLGAPDYEGMMDEFSIWAKALSETEVQSMINNKLSGNESNLRLYYNFNEDPNSGSVNDQTSAQRNGTIVGTPSRLQPDGSAPCVEELFPPNSDCGTVLTFDGVDDHIITNAGANIFTNKDFTLEAWIYIEDYSTSMASVIFGNRPKNEQVLFFVCGEMQGANKGKLRVQLGTGGTPSESLLGNTVLQTKKWYHVAFSYDFTSAGHNANAKMYVNGELDGSWTGVTDTRIYLGDRVPMDKMYLGFEQRASSPAEYHFNGKMDEVRIWGDVRSDLEIENFRDSSLIQSEEDLMLSFNFNEGKNADMVNSIAKPMVYEGEMINMDTINAWTKVNGDPVLNTYNEITITACDSFIAPSGLVFDLNGSYTDVISNSLGCDSTIRINLEVINQNKPNAFIWNNDPGKFDVTSGNVDGYEWVKCDDTNGQVYATTKVFYPTEPGDYMVRTLKNGCYSVFSDCLTYVSTVSNNNIDQLIKETSIFPNPTTGKLLISTVKELENLSVEVFDITGSIIHSEDFGSSNQFQIQLNGAPGIYFVKINSDNNGSVIKRVVKK